MTVETGHALHHFRLYIEKVHELIEIESTSYRLNTLNSVLVWLQKLDKTAMALSKLCFLSRHRSAETQCWEWYVCTYVRMYAIISTRNMPARIESRASGDKI